MNYKAWPDEDLRRVLLTDPDDTSAICEAAERFAKQVKTYDEDEEEAQRESGRQEGYDDDGYDSGYAEGKRDFQ